MCKDLTKINNGVNIMYDTSDNKLNIEMTKQPLLYRALFIMTNLPYLYVAIHLLGFIPKTDVVHIAFIPVCSHNNAGHYIMMIITIASTTFHCLQCNCKCDRDVGYSAILNNADIFCACASCVWLFICFFKLKLVLFAPCVLFMYIGSVYKLKRQYKLYFLFHGLWHISTAAMMYNLMCNI